MFILRALMNSIIELIKRHLMYKTLFDEETNVTQRSR
mgnify:CR=1 FL=1